MNVSGGQAEIKPEFANYLLRLDAMREMSHHSEIPFDEETGRQVVDFVNVLSRTMYGLS